MKYRLSLLLFSVATFTINAQSIVGKWKTIDDEDGKAKSHVEIYVKKGKIYGKVSKLINPEAKNCGKCEGIKKDQPIVGMEILWNLVKD
jgi:hypothetical protein